MTESRTTFWGAIGGAATAMQAVPSLPAWCRALALIVCALAFGALGYHATDCPPDCPGSDAQGRRLHPPRPTLLLGLLLLLAMTATVAAVLLCSGCTVLRARSYVETGQGTNRVQKGAALWGVTFFDSGQILGKTKVSYESATNGAWPPEISTAGLTQQSSSTGLVLIIQNFPQVVPVP